MREILFRGKRTNNGEWVEGFYSQIVECVLPPYKDELYGKLVTLENRHKYLIRETIRTLTNALFDVIPETVGQFTGLTDKNGKKIFEGDIIKENYSLNGNERGIRSVIEYGIEYSYSNVCGVCQRFSDGSGRAMLSIENKNGTVFCEVIGNIHDNPELLA